MVWYKSAHFIFSTTPSIFSGSAGLHFSHIGFPIVELTLTVLGPIACEKVAKECFAMLEWLKIPVIITLKRVLHKSYHKS